MEGGRRTDAIFTLTLLFVTVSVKVVFTEQGKHFIAVTEGFDFVQN